MSICSKPLLSLVQQRREIAHLVNAGQLMHWDKVTIMPKNGSKIRDEQKAYLIKLAHAKATSGAFKTELEKFVNLITGDVIYPNLPDHEARMLKEIWRDWHHAVALPNEFVEKLTLLDGEAYTAWESAKTQQDFKLFAPDLERRIKTAGIQANYLNPDSEPYDVLLDLHEPGMTQAQLTPLFDELKHQLKTLLKKIQTKSRPNVDFSQFDWPLDQQANFIKAVIYDLKFDLNSGYHAISAHPFETSFHPTDTRFTTRYNMKDPRPAILSSIHECGHGLYDQGLNPDWYGTPLCQAISTAMHESQSRFYEMRIGRSLAFWKHYYPLLQDHFHSNLKNISLNDFYSALNQVKPSLIRIEADEITYHMHIIIRYEIEQALMSGEIQIQELPELWNAKYTDYLEVTPSNDSDGILQDVHWSLGLFGYFPTYTLGSMYACQLYETAAADLPDLETQIQKGEFSTIREWLRTNIHQLGRARRSDELIKEITGKPVTAKPLIDYLNSKYTAIYNV